MGRAWTERRAPVEPSNYFAGGVLRTATLLI